MPRSERPDPSTLYTMFQFAAPDERALDWALGRHRERQGYPGELLLVGAGELAAYVPWAQARGLTLRAHPLPRGCLLIGRDGP